MLNDAFLIAVSLCLDGIGLAQNVTDKVHVMDVHIHGDTAAAGHGVQPVVAGPFGSGADAVELGTQDLAVNAAVDHFLEPLVLGPLTDDLTDLHLGTGLGLGLEDQFHLFLGQADGLLHEHVLACLHGGNSVRNMQIGGQADVNDIHIGLLDQFHTGLIVGNALTHELFSKILAGIGNSDDLDTQICQCSVAGSVHAAHKSAANQTNFNHFTVLLS